MFVSCLDPETLANYCPYYCPYYYYYCRKFLKKWFQVTSVVYRQALSQPDLNLDSNATTPPKLPCLLLLITFYGKVTIPFLSKILEKVVSQQLVSHIDNHSRSARFQSGPQLHHYTEVTLLTFTNDIRESDKGNVTALVLLDWSAAFGTVNHDILLSQIETDVGVSGVALSWFLSINLIALNMFRVRLSYMLLSCRDLRRSSRFSLLFCIYTRPLKLILKKRTSAIIPVLTTHSYTYPFDSSKSSTAIDTLNSFLADIRSWMSPNFLTLSANITELS